MSYQPVVPFAGYSGWKFLNRTMVQQKTAFLKAPEIKRDTDYFKANIGKINTADELVADRRLLSVTLSAFGLDSDIQAKAFIRKVLADGTLEPEALANRLADKRYLDLSKAFGFGDFATPSTKISDFGPKITALYEARQFEVAVGNQDENLRIALSLPRDLAAIANKTSSEATKWFTVLGNAPLRQAFQSALGLPDSFASIDLDKQLKTIEARAETTFGNNTVAQFKDPAKIERLVQLFLLRSEAAQTSAQTFRGASVLGLLQAGQSQFNMLLGR